MSIDDLADKRSRGPSGKDLIRGFGGGGESSEWQIGTRPSAVDTVGIRIAALQASRSIALIVAHFAAWGRALPLGLERIVVVKARVTTTATEPVSTAALATIRPQVPSRPIQRMNRFIKDLQSRLFHRWAATSFGKG